MYTHHKRVLSNILFTSSQTVLVDEPEVILNDASVRHELHVQVRRGSRVAYLSAVILAQTI